MSSAKFRVEPLVEKLLLAGMSSAEATRKGELFERAFGGLQQDGMGYGDMNCWYVPGRVELFGKHTDYCGGASLLCALERGLCVVARPRQDGRVRVLDSANALQTECDITGRMVARIGHWSNYPHTVIGRLVHNFPACHRGMDMAFASDLPAAAGLSSSSALVTAVCMSFAHINQLEMQPLFQRIAADPANLAAYLGAIESGRDYQTLAGDAGVGTAGGAGDHTAILCSRAGEVTHAEFAGSSRLVGLPFDSQHRLVIAVSGAVAEKTGAARMRYNQIAATAGQAVELFNRHRMPPAASLEECFLQMQGDAAAVMRLITAGVADAAAVRRLHERVNQFDEESHRIVPAAARMLGCKKLSAIGVLADQSHLLAATLLHNQTPETDFLVGEAQRQGALAASAFGAGFGGSVWALLPHEAADAFAVTWEKAYLAEFPAVAERADVFVTRPGPPAMRLG